MQKSDRTQVLKQEIDTRIAAYFASPAVYMGAGLSPNGEEALRILAEFTVRPSKRLRGILAITAYEMFGGTNHAAALDLALAMELAQSYLLIIDDVMDRSKTRRGGPSVHEEYLHGLHRSFKTRRLVHEANMGAVIVGELAQHLASAVLNAIDAPAEQVLLAERLFHINLAATAHGQIDDLLGNLGQPQSIQQTLAMYIRKTCHYTFINPLQTGAALAKSDANDLAALKQFGVHAGIAFQLQDDDIGMFGNVETSGKSSLDDLREGKMTVLMRYALVHAASGDVKTLHTALGNKRVTHEQHMAVCTILEKTGARAYALQEAQRANGAALAVLDTQMQWAAPFKRVLQELLESLIGRAS